ncbi:MAG: alpha/beta hydrolase [Actinomycetia bacterium]|nr:alpha/beta hydrolase [Actinomycetes bacterium]
MDLTSFSAQEIASDTSDIVGMLGYSSVNLFGASFGSRIALTYAALASSSTVRSVVLEGPYPPDVDGVARRGEAASAGLGALFDACRRDPSCNSAYPDLEPQLVDVVTRLDDTPLILTGGEVVNGHRFMEAVYRTAYSGSGIQRIPRLIGDTAQGDLALLSELLDTTAMTFDDVDAIAYFATVCSTTSPVSSALLASTVEALPEGVATYFYRLGMATLDLCEAAGLVGSGTIPGPTSAPTLYLVGTYDPVTPPEWSRDGANGSWPGMVAELSYGTHANLFHPESCAGQAVFAFVATLEHPHLPCLSTTLPIDFDL